MNLEAIKSFLRYSDWCNEEIERSAAAVDDAGLDRPFDMGLGTLRRTFQHIRDAEQVWLQRWMGKVEVPWPKEQPVEPVRKVGDDLRRNAAERDAFVKSVIESNLTKIIPYRDSKGSMYETTLLDMMLQTCIHSAHHRAQAVNMLRRVGRPVLDLDYMYWCRKPRTER